MDAAGVFRLSVIACPTLRPELEMLAAGCGGEITFHHLEMSLHERNAVSLRRALQTAVDQAINCDTVAIAYGLCNHGIVGITARDVPLVVPRSYDCIGLLLGSNRRYLQELANEPGTYFQSIGWLKAVRDERQPEFAFGPHSDAGLERLRERYGEEAAGYLTSAFESFTTHYTRLAYIATPDAANPVFEAQARDIAERRGWRYHCLDSDTGWLRRLFERQWEDAEFLIVPPGQTVVLANGDRLIEAAEVP